MIPVKIETFDGETGLNISIFSENSFWMLLIRLLSTLLQIINTWNLALSRRLKGVGLKPSREAPVALSSLSVSGLRIATDAAMCRVATSLLAHALLVQLTNLRVDCTHIFHHPLHHCSNVARFDRVQPITCLHALSKHLQPTKKKHIIFKSWKKYKDISWLTWERMTPCTRT